MAAEILLLVALFSNIIHAEILSIEGRPHHFLMDKTADVCLISRWSGEEKKLLWSSSQHQDYNLQRNTDYQISRMDVSDSGQYQVQCSTQNDVTYEKNSTLLVCGRQKMRHQKLYAEVGQTLELTCERVGPNQSVMWAVTYYNHNIGNWELSLLDDEMSSMYKHQLLKNKPSLLVTFGNNYYDLDFYCLKKNHQKCELLTRFSVDVQLHFIHRWVGESLELNCSEISFNKHVWSMFNLVMEDEKSFNYTLMFPSLTLNHTGEYICDHSDLYREQYFLRVCPAPDPPAVVFVTRGESVTLECGDGDPTGAIHWFMRTIGTERRVSPVRIRRKKDRIHISDTSLVITDVSLEDNEEFWCSVEKDYSCVSSYKTLVIFREVDHHLVRSVLLSVVILSKCVVVVAVFWRTRSREQLPVPVEEVEMSDLSPASADLQSETL